MDPKITLVTLGVADIETSIRFYRDGLGFPMQDRAAESDIAFFPLEGTWLSVYPRGRLADDATVPAGEPGFSGITLAHNVSAKKQWIRSSKRPK